MPFRASPLWWPLMVVASPIIIPFLALKNSRFRKNCARATDLNQGRLDRAKPLELPNWITWR